MSDRPMSAGDWWAAQRVAALAAAKRLSEAHFAETEAIPDLEFLTPDCPVCSESTEVDDGWFLCMVCEVTWPSSGYGHEAERHS